MSLENLFVMMLIILFMLIIEMVRLRCKVERLEAIFRKEIADEAKQDLL